MGAPGTDSGDSGGPKSNSADSAEGTDVGAAVGGTFGALFLVGLILAGAWYYRQHYMKKEGTEEGRPGRRASLDETDIKVEDVRTSMSTTSEMTWSMMTWSTPRTA